MPKMTASSVAPRKRRLASFTLVELLFVMAIILILAALILGAGSGAMKKAARSRASGEIQAMSTALEGYKIDNGIYPATNVATSFGMANSLLLTNIGTDPYFSQEKDGTGTTGTDYQKTSQVLFLALTGMTNFSDNPAPGVKSYMSFKANQVGDPNGTVTGASYVKDPWGYSYGYSIGTAASYPYNGTGFFDLWSTGGVTKAKIVGPPTNYSLTNAWISNWQ
jgi:type II secretory pathway pseudopilin PulG